MRIQLLSDLHNEFYRHSGAPDIADSDADVVILAGDIDVGVHGLTWAISEAQRLDKPIIYVAGNHEFYHHDLALLEELRQIAAGNERVHVLENDEVVIGM
jgi:predicted phosphodiesterase